MSHQVRTPESDRSSVERGLDSLQGSTEFGGPIEPVDDAHAHHCNDHIALIHETREEQFAAVVPFLREGIDADERCLYVVEDTSRELVEAALREGGVDVDAAVESGQLSFHTVAETYLRNEEFCPDEMIEFYGDAIESATESYEGLRVAAETGWLLDDSTELEDWMAYESRVNELFAGEDCLALCQYDRTRLPAELVRDLVQTHPHLVYDDTVCHNFYYTPPEEFLGTDQPDRELERMLRTLVDRTRAKTELAEQHEYLRRQNEITSDPERSFEGKLQDLFELGCERFDLEHAGMAAVDGGTDRFELEAISDDHPHLETGIELPLSETYCDVTESAETVVGVTDPWEAGLDDRTVHREYGIRTYLGTCIRIDGGADRSFFFVSADRREPFSDDEREFLRLMSHWVKYELEQRGRERRMEALNELNQSLLTAETVESVVETLVDAADSLGLPVTCIGRYDPEVGELRCTGRTDEAERVLASLEPFETGEGVGWEAFLGSERRRRPAGDRSPAAEVLAIPLSSQGVMVTALAPGTVSDARIDFAETVGANVTTALERAAREQQLHAREAELEDQNETLSRLDRINTTIRAIDQALVSAASRSEIESVVCDRLTDAGPYTFAWIGARDAPDAPVVPEERAGTGSGFLGDITDDDEPRLAERAAAARETRVVNDLLTDSSNGRWRQAALTRGYHAAIALPLVYDDTMFGVLTVFADQPGVFDDLEEAVLSELADNIAHAINAVENKRSLVGTDVTELTFEVPVDEFPFGDMVRETGGVFDHEGVVPGDGDEELRWFFSTRGVDAEAVLAHESRLPVTALELLSTGTVDGETVCLFEARHPFAGLPRDLLEHGGKIHDLRAADGTVSISIDVHAGTTVREFVEMFQTKYPSAELVAKHDRERSLESVTELRAALTEDLTDRQREVVEAAYYSGYFEEPRTRTGSEIADSLDISQPTFATHLRTAERKIYGELFGDAP